MTLLNMFPALAVFLSRAPPSHVVNEALMKDGTEGDAAARSSYGW